MNTAQIVKHLSELGCSVTIAAFHAEMMKQTGTDNTKQRHVSSHLKDKSDNNVGVKQQHGNNENSKPKRKRKTPTTTSTENNHDTESYTSCSKLHTNTQHTQHKQRKQQQHKPIKNDFDDSTTANDDVEVEKTENNNDTSDEDSLFNHHMLFGPKHAQQQAVKQTMEAIKSHAQEKEQHNNHYNNDNDTSIIEVQSDSDNENENHSDITNHNNMNDNHSNHHNNNSRTNNKTKPATDACMRMLLACQTFKSIHGHCDMKTTFRINTHDEKWPANTRGWTVGAALAAMRQGKVYQRVRDDVAALGFRVTAGKRGVRGGK